MYNLNELVAVSLCILETENSEKPVLFEHNIQELLDEKR